MFNYELFRGLLLTRAFQTPMPSLVQKLQPMTPQRSPRILRNPSLHRINASRAAHNQHAEEPMTPTKPARGVGHDLM